MVLWLTWEYNGFEKVLAVRKSYLRQPMARRQFPDDTSRPGKSEYSPRKRKTVVAFPAFCQDRRWVVTSLIHPVAFVRKFVEKLRLAPVFQIQSALQEEKRDLGAAIVAF